MVSAGKIIIVGLGVTGASCVRYFVRTGRAEDLLVVDTRKAPPGLAGLVEDFPDLRLRTGATELDFDGVEQVVVSPGVALTDPILHGRPESVRLASDIDIFCEASSAPIIAVTGTNGKSTVTSLAGHLLREAGVRAVVGGNLGEAALDLLERQADVYVLELSSFQLERLAEHPFVAATILNVSEDHLDRHGDMTAYIAAKQNVYRNCELAVVHRGEPQTYPSVDCATTSFGADVPNGADWGVRQVGGERWLAYGKTALVPSAELPLAGVHNELNVLAAMALAHTMSVSPAAMAGAVLSFTGLPHRCERVAHADGVAYINDSKATNVGATVAALVGLGGLSPESVPRIILIAGGDGKGADFQPLADVVERFVKALILLGRDGPLIAEALGAHESTIEVPTEQVSSMEKAVARAREIAEPGDLVLLSPACASFDMYENFAARGDHFSRTVVELAA